MLDVPTYEFLEPRVGFSLPPRRDQRCDRCPLRFRVAGCAQGVARSKRATANAAFCLMRRFASRREQEAFRGGFGVPDPPRDPRQRC